MRDPIYLDHNASTPLLPEALDAMLPYLRTRHGNPSSQHAFGQTARKAVEHAREQVAALIGATPDEIVFTSGGTEANNLAVRGAVEASPAKRHVVTSNVEHSAIGVQCTWLEGHGHRFRTRSDTEVVLDGEVFGKPADDADAAAMLRRLSGRTHQVLSSVWVVSPSRELQALSMSEVTFAELTPAQIDAYVASGEPRGRAGAYAIQGLAEAFTTRLSGSYSGVMGLPLYETAEMLRAAGVRVWSGAA